MDNSSRKAIFLDLDETLLTTDKRISDRNASLLHRMLDEGHIVAFNTGRPVRAIKTIVQPYGFDRPGCYYMGFHGSAIIDGHTNETIMVNSIDTEHAIDLIRTFREAGIYVQCFDSEHLLTFDDCQTLERYNKVTHEPVIFLQSYDELLDKKIAKVMGIDYENHDILVDFQNTYKEKEGEYMNSFFSCTPYLEYCKYGSHKGTGLKALSDYLGISTTNTVACGDERNDIPMIMAAGVGVAMKNARPEAKEVADYITLNDNNNDGIAEVIEKFILI